MCNQSQHARCATTLSPPPSPVELLHRPADGNTHCRAPKHLVQVLTPAGRPRKERVSVTWWQRALPAPGPHFSGSHGSLGCLASWWICMLWAARGSRQWGWALSKRRAATHFQVGRGLRANVALELAVPGVAALAVRQAGRSAALVGGGLRHLAVDLRSGVFRRLGLASHGVTCAGDSQSRGGLGGSGGKGASPHSRRGGTTDRRERQRGPMSRAIRCG